MNGGDGSAARTTLGVWIWLYAALVWLATFALGAAVARFWTDTLALDRWAVITGLLTSGSVALFSGLVTIFITWRISQHFGDESSSSVERSLRASLSAVISAPEDVDRAVAELLAYAAEESGSVVVFLSGGRPLDESENATRIVSHLRERFSSDRTTILASHLAGSDVLSSDPVLKEVGVGACEARNFFERATSRRSLVFPLPTRPALTAAVCLSISSEGSRLEVARSVFATWPKGADSPPIGARTSIDEQFARAVLSHVCDLIEEPRSPGATAHISVDDILADHWSGIPVTRSLVSTQILWGAYRGSRVGPGPGHLWTIEAMSPAEGGSSRSEFKYAPTLFLPPVVPGSNHSGSVIAALIESGAIQVKDKSVLEVGSGAGYLTVALAGAVGSGTVIALDNDPRALAATKENTKSLLQNAQVDFVRADAGNLRFTSEVSSGVAQTSFTVEGDGRPCAPVDIVLLELPLIPYRGGRSLTAFETPYLEPACTTGSVLPKTVEAVLRQLDRSIAADPTLEVIVPVCIAEADDATAAEAAVKAILPSADIRWIGDEGGFVRVIQATQGQSQK